MTPHNARRHRHGILVALEGIDGAGKSSLLRTLGRALRRRGYTVRLWHEPVDRAIGRLAQEAGAHDPWTGAVYFTIDRHLAAPRLRADLRRFDVVLSDRSFYSTVAYQGSRLPARDRARLEQLQEGATVPPDTVLLLDLPLSWLGRRLDRRGASRGPLERSKSLSAVARAYRTLARQHRWAVLDARQPPNVLLGEALRALGPWATRTRDRGKTIRATRGPHRPA